MQSRRAALKTIAGLGVVAGGFALGTQSANATTHKDIKSKIVILGAGLGGISLASKLINDAPNATVILVDEDETFYYQPGFTLIAVGEYTKDDVVFEKSHYMPDGVQWVRQNATKITPELNSITLADGQTLSYDYLVVASGVEYEPLKGAGENATTIYTLEGALKSNTLMSEFAKKGGKALFADQASAMKCSGANKKVAMMAEDRLRLAGNRDKGSLELFGGARKLFSAPIYEKTIERIFLERDIKYHLSHQIVEIDTARNMAIFEHSMHYKEDGENRVSKEFVEAEFDWLHYTPKQKASHMYKEAGLSVEGSGNWVSVNKQTLQSTKFSNIFAIGDICGFPMAKTGASIRKMYPVVAHNIIATIKGEPLLAGFDGYTACPLITKYGKAIMVEFDWSGRPKPSMECFGATRESAINWYIKTKAFKPMVMHGMLSGRA